MNRNTQPQPARVVANPVPPRSPLRLILTVLGAGLGLLLLGTCGGGAALWLHYRAGNPGADATSARGRTDTTQRPACSDDDDPKYLEALEFGPPVEVPFDRHFLNALADRPIPTVEVYPWLPERLVAILGEHRMRGSQFAFSPDGTMLAVTSGDSFLRIGGIDTLHEKYVLPCPGGAGVVAWAPDGNALAVSCGDGVVRLFDVRDLARVPEPVALEKPGAAVSSLSYSGDGKYLLGGDRTPKRGSAWLWDVASRKLAGPPLRHIGPVLSVALSPVPGDYRALTGGGPEDGQLHLWDAVAGQERATVDFRPSKTDVTVYVGEVAFSPDGKRALSCHPDAAVRLWDLDHLEKGKELQTLPGHTVGGSPVATFSPDGQSVATARVADGGVWLWNAADGKQVRRLATSGGVFMLRFLPGGDRLLFAGTISNDANVHLHEVASGKEILPPQGHLAGLTSVALAPAGQVVASGGNDLSVRLWDLATVQQRHSLGAGQAWGVGFHPDGKRVLFYGGSSAILSFADADSGQPRTPPYNQQHGGAVNSAAVTRDGRYALTAGFNDNTVRMCALQDGRQVRLFNLGPNQGPGVVTVAPDMRRAIRVGGPKTRLLQLRCQEVKHEWNPVSWAPFLPDGRAVFFGGPNDPLWTIAADKVEQTGRFDLDLAGVGPGHVSADGKRVAAVVGARVSVFELASARQLWTWTPPPHFGGVHGVALSPDGGHLLTANGDGTVYVVGLP